MHVEFVHGVFSKTKFNSPPLSQLFETAPLLKPVGQPTFNLPTNLTQQRRRFHRLCGVSWTTLRLGPNGLLLDREWALAGDVHTHPTLGAFNFVCFKPLVTNVLTV